MIDVVWGVVWGFLVFVLVGLLAAACGGGATDGLRSTIAGAARVVVAVDAATAERMAETREAHLAASETRAAFEARRRGYYRVQEAVAAARAGLEAAEAALDAGEADGAAAVLGCVALAMERLGDAAAEVGVELPADMLAIVATAARLGGCGRQP